MTTSEEAKKIVWVLGAGFSKPLGGPLLTGLLSRESEKDIVVRYPKEDYPHLHGDSPDIVRSLYWHGLSDDRMWTHAEEFLDYVDTAAEPPASRSTNPHAERLRRVLDSVFNTKIEPDLLRATARRLVAAECCWFLEGIDTRREPWRPFRRWAGLLGWSDTIVSFNYDRVIEMLRAAHDADVRRLGVGSTSPIATLAPGNMEDPKGACRLLKLHGSVDWMRGKLADKVVTRVVPDERFALTCSDDLLAIATPGPSKQRFADEVNELWRLASSAIGQADAIVFVGYRFPETDAIARERLLGAISENDRPRLYLHIVLGDSHDHAARLESLLTYACRARRSRSDGVTIDRHPLFTQDFLTVVSRDDL